VGGEKELALQQLEAGLRAPDASQMLSYGALKLLPFWDPLRGDPRFEKNRRVTCAERECREFKEVNFQEFLRRIEAPQRLQGCGRVRGRRVAFASGVVDFLSRFRCAGMVMKIFIIIIIFGFPVALIFSWAFEITPEGIKLESEIEPNKSIKRRTGRKICCRNDRACCRRGGSVRVSTRALEINSHASTERGGYSGP